MNSRLLYTLLVVFLISNTCFSEEADLIIYGGSPAGLVTAIAASRENPNLSIVIVEPTRWIGGMVTGGLSRTDKGQEKTIGGITREIFERAKDLGGDETPLWYAEPRHNMAVFREMLAECGDRVSVLHGSRVASVTKEKNQIREIALEDGKTLSGRVFVDASYEGDLMARAGVSYIVGRESRDTYGEELAGYTAMPIRPHGPDVMGQVCSCLDGDAPHFIHGTPTRISAYDKKGDLIPGVFQPDSKAIPGSGDSLTQAYNFRICVTQREDIRVPFPKPDHYDPKQFELLLRLIDSYPSVRFGRLVHLGKIANGKYDLNAQGLFSTDYAGGNRDYPDAGYPSRDEIFQDHLDYVQGFLWFLGHDERVPAALRDEVNSWGLCSDEFTDNHSWPYALYVREARRMIGEYVLRQEDTWTSIIKPDTVGMGSFILDCHIVQRIVTEDGIVTDEGSFQDSPTRPYQIPYRSLLPKRQECENLLVPVCLSASHIAYCSIRMEPVYMALGQACGIASSMALKSPGEEAILHEVSVTELQKKLRNQNAVLELEGLAELVMVEKLPGIAIDDRDAEFTGSWSHSAYGAPVEGSAAHDGNGGKGEKTATFRLQLPEGGRYEVRLAYAASSNRSSAVPIDIRHAGGTSTVTIDQRKTPEHDELFTTLGTWNFSTSQEAVVTIRTDKTNSYVSVDAIQFLKTAD